jgi:Helix-hairpin-helix domain
MVHGDVELDVNGVPVNLPQIRYERTPMTIRKPGSYEDWLQRNAGFSRLIRAIGSDVQDLARQVAKLEWERELRMRPPMTQKVIEFNKRITDVLEGGADPGHGLILELRQSYLAQGRIYPAASLAKAIQSISIHPTPILSGEEAQVLPGVGASTGNKIQEIIDTVPPNQIYVTENRET